MPNKLRFKLGAGSNRYKIERLKAVLEHKTAQLHKLEQIHQALAKREQVLSGFVTQQGDLLHHLGCLLFRLPAASDAAAERQQTATIEALLKDMEAAQLLEAASSLTRSDGSTTSTTCAVGSCETAGAAAATTAAAAAAAAGEPQDSVLTKQLRLLLSSPDIIQRVCAIRAAQLEELAGLLRDSTMRMRLLLSTYPTDNAAAAAAAAMDNEAEQDKAGNQVKTRAQIQQQRLSNPRPVPNSDPVYLARKRVADVELEKEVDHYVQLCLLLHMTQEKILRLSLINLDTMQPETPSSSYWQEIAEKMDLRPDQVEQIHMGFIWYNTKRSCLTAQMQEAVQQLQQLMSPQGTAPCMSPQLPGDVSVQAAQLRGGLAVLNSGDTAAAAAYAIAAGVDAADGRGAIGSRSGRSVGSSSKLASWCGMQQQQQQQQQQQPPLPPPAVMGAYQGLSWERLEHVEQADKLLQQLGKLVWQLRECSRCLIFQFMNALDSYQTAVCTVLSWPFLPQPPPMCEALTRMQVAKQQQLRQQDLSQQQHHQHHH